jgi:hypothetical protein
LVPRWVEVKQPVEVTDDLLWVVNHQPQSLSTIRNALSGLLEIPVYWVNQLEAKQKSTLVATARAAAQSDFWTTPGGRRSY